MNTTDIINKHSTQHGLVTSINFSQAVLDIAQHRENRIKELTGTTVYDHLISQLAQVAERIKRLDTEAQALEGQARYYTTLHNGKVINALTTRALELDIMKYLQSYKNPTLHKKKLLKLDREEQMRVVNLYNTQLVTLGKSIIIKPEAQQAVTSHTRKIAEYNDAIREKNSLNKKIEQLISQ